MTNGEKFKQIFEISQVDDCDLSVYAWLPIHDAIEIPLEWWNEEYKGPDSVIDLIWEEIENIYLEMPDDYNHFQRTQFYREIKRVFDRYRIGEIKNDS